MKTPVVGDCVFIPRGEKRRPYMVIAVAEVAGVPYNWIGIPVTSKTTVKEENLVPVTHPKLKEKSYAKIIDPFTFVFDKHMELKDVAFLPSEVEDVRNRYLDFIKNQVINEQN